MNHVTRRETLAVGAGLGAGALLGGQAHAAIPMANVPPPKHPIEKGATLRILRPTKFVDPDETVWRENTAKFAAEMGVPVRVDFVGWEDLRPQTAVAARTGAGPDVVVSWGDDPHLYADKILDMTELNGYLAKKYGGWHLLAEKYGKKYKSESWLSVPMGAGGGALCYRESWVKEAGYDKIPMDLSKFLDLCRKLKKNNHPAGFALGNAQGDGNGFAHWLLWAHGGAMVDDAGKPTLNTKATIEALKYGKALYETFIPGTLSWLDPSNNKAYIAGEIGLTQNGVSIYVAARNDPKTKHIADDTNHSRMPNGTIGKPAESANCICAMVFNHSKYPNAAKEYLRYMMEAEQYDKWLSGSDGYWGHVLKAFDQSDTWKRDPKIVAFKDASAMPFWLGYKGPISAASGAVVADYVMVQMFAGVASGQSTPEEAIKEAEKRITRAYRNV